MKSIIKGLQSIAEGFLSFKLFPPPMKPVKYNTFRDHNNIKERTDPNSHDSLSRDESLYLCNTRCCPDCGSKLLPGPCGGCSQNMACSNTECASEFNGAIEFGWIERNGKISAERYRYVYGIKD
tara:strand:+ start:106212 stop:106583 length:372 start_codon:yes stop_codon:yes gene_type:complete